MIKKTDLYTLVIIFFMTLSTASAREILVVIKAISKTKKTFAIRKGLKDGIRQGQKSLFSTDKASISARVTSVTRYYSTWQMEVQGAQIPFQKGQIVNYTNSLERIWTRVGMLKYLKLKGQVEFKNIRKFNNFSRIIISGSFARAFSDNIKEIEDYEPLARQGISFEALYLRRFNSLYDIGGGLRFDSETATKVDPSFTITTTRFFIQAVINRNFKLDTITNNQFYIGTAIGFGNSSSNILDDIKSGPSFLFPTLKLGRRFDALANYSLFAEINFEYISSVESFDDGDAQTSTIMASRFVLGAAF